MQASLAVTHSRCGDKAQAGGEGEAEGWGGGPVLPGSVSSSIPASREAATQAKGDGEKMVQRCHFRDGTREACGMQRFAKVTRLLAELGAKLLEIRFLFSLFCLLGPISVVVARKVPVEAGRLGWIWMAHGEEGAGLGQRPDRVLPGQGAMARQVGQAGPGLPSPKEHCHEEGTPCSCRTAGGHPEPHPCHSCIAPGSGGA